MRNELREKVAMFRAVNDITLQGEIAVFGSTFMANFPFYELSRKYMMTSAVYNRSVEGLTLAEAEEVLPECVLDIKPSKIFLALGEKDISDPDAMTIYRRILWKIKEKLPKAQLFVLPVQKDACSENDGGRIAFNENLRTLAERMEVTFLDVPAQASLGALYEKIFKKLNCFFHGNRRLTFVEAFSYGN